MSGKTDPQIVLEYLAEFDLPDAHTHVPAILEGLEAELAARAHEVSARGAVLPGVAELLPRLAADDDVDQTVLTGNIAPNARVKVAAFGLDRWLNLEMGAYGSDDRRPQRARSGGRGQGPKRHGDDASSPTRSGWWAIPPTIWPAPGPPACAACWWPRAARASTSSGAAAPTPFVTT